MHDPSLASAQIGADTRFVATLHPLPSRRSASRSARPDDGNDDGDRELVRALVARAREGDRDAFGELYRRHHAGVFRLARFHLGEGADDIVAETFLRAWKGLPRYRDTGAPFSAWLYGIARHVVADEGRRRARTEPRSELPERSYEVDDDERLTLAAAIAGLPKEQRLVIELRYLMGMGNREVAAILGTTPGAVNSLRWRALRALRGGVER